MKIIKKLNRINFLLNTVYYGAVIIVNMFYKYRFMYTVSLADYLAIFASISCLKCFVVNKIT